MSRKALLTAALVVWVAALTEAQGARTVRDGIFTDAQAARGQAVYQKQCASCHGDKLQGLQGPPLVADAFLSHWQTHPLWELASKIRNTMPAGATGTLTPQPISWRSSSRPAASRRARPSWRRTKRC